MGAGKKAAQAIDAYLKDGQWCPPLFGHPASSFDFPDFRAVPYCAWANRGASEMVVWLPRQ